MTEPTHDDVAKPPPTEARAKASVTPGVTASGVARYISAAEILGPEGVAYLEHEGELYTLRRTRAGRLILTK